MIQKNIWTEVVLTKHAVLSDAADHWAGGRTEFARNHTAWASKSGDQSGGNFALSPDCRKMTRGACFQSSWSNRKSPSECRKHSCRSSPGICSVYYFRVARMQAVQTKWNVNRDGFVNKRAQLGDVRGAEFCSRVWVRVCVWLARSARRCVLVRENLSASGDRTPLLFDKWTNHWADVRKMHFTLCSHSRHGADSTILRVQTRQAEYSPLDHPLRWTRRVEKPLAAWSENEVTLFCAIKFFLKEVSLHSAAKWLSSTNTKLLHSHYFSI